VQPWFAKYCSTSRTLYRGCWFFDFVAALLQGLSADRESMMSKVALKAYKEALAPHHPWALKQAATLAMKAVKKREKFIASVCKEQTEVRGQDYSEAQFYEDFAKLGQLSGAVAGQLWQFCKAKDLVKLP
jgi:hypothetical protein